MISTSMCSKVDFENRICNKYKFLSPCFVQQLVIIVSNGRGLGSETLLCVQKVHVMINEVTFNDCELILFRNNSNLPYS